MNSSVLLILALLFFAGALLAAWAGIRSIQSARSVVFYRTRQARMAAGRQWLAFSLALVLFAFGSIAFAKPLSSQAGTPTAVPTLVSVAMTSTLLPIVSPTDTIIPVQTSTLAELMTATVTPPLRATDSLSTSWAGMLTQTGTAFAMQTQQKSTFIAALSSTPTITRTPVPTWTRTPSRTPPPTYTASPTRTPRPTITLIPTHTPRPTWTASPTRTPVTPSSTWTPSPTRTPPPTITPTSTPTRTQTPTP